MVVVPDDLVGRPFVEHGTAPAARDDVVDLSARVWFGDSGPYALKSLGECFPGRLCDGLPRRSGQFADKAICLRVLDTEGHDYILYTASEKSTF